MCYDSYMTKNNMSHTNHTTTFYGDGSAWIVCSGCGWGFKSKHLNELITEARTHADIVAK